MPQGTLDPKSISVDLERLDQLIATLRRSADNELLVEHLHSARVSLLGAMPAEYAGSLRSAREASSLVAEPRLRETLRQVLDYLVTEISERPRVGHAPARPEHREPPPAGTRSRLWSFFGAPPVSFGVFYPEKYIVAVFPSFAAVKHAEATLKQADFAEDEVLAVSGEEMLQFFEELHEYEGLWGALMSRLSRLFATEEAFVDADMQRARQGAGFLAIYCPEEALAERVCDLLTPFEPAGMQLYLASGVQSLI